MSGKTSIVKDNDVKLEVPDDQDFVLLADRLRAQRMRNLDERGRSEEAEQERTKLSKLSFFAWSQRIPEPKFGKLDFEHFPYLHELYEWPVDDEEGVVQKGSQVGASSWMIRWAIYFADVRGRTALYVFPKDEQGRKFSNTRIKPVIQGSEYLRGRVSRSQINNVHERQIGAGFFHMAGSQSVEGLESIDADVLALDEYDYLVQAHIPFAEKRITGPLSLGLVRRIGFPTVGNFGINRKFLASDKRQWHVKCGACGHWQTIDFWKNIDQKRMLRVCSECRKPVDVSKGEWVAEHPDRPTRGYHLSKLIVPNLRINKVIEEANARRPFEVQNFYNRTLGIPYEQPGGRLSYEAIVASQERGNYSMGPRERGYTGDNLVTMGVDVASVRNLNVRISEHLDDRTRRALWIGEVENFDDLDTLMRAFGVHMAAIDHLPEGRHARAFAERHPGQVYIVNFATAAQKDVISVEEDQRRVSVKRTEAHDTVIQLVKDMRNLLPWNVPDGYVEHLQAPVKRLEKDEELDKVDVFYVSTGADDYFMAELYDVMATEMFWLRVAVEAAKQEEVHTLDEYVPFQRSALGRGGDNTYRAGPDDTYNPGPGS